MKNETLLAGFLPMFAFMACDATAEKQETAAAQYQVYCGSCHLAPDPTPLSRFQPRVLAADDDLDGDWDFAVLAYFADFAHTPEESFVFPENKDPQQYRFQSHVTQQATSGRWLVMDQGDYDHDGDPDLLLGAYALPLHTPNAALSDRWRRERAVLLLLENTIVR